MPDKSQAPAWMSETSEKLKNTSGFVIVCPEYNCTIPPALTNLLDYFPPPIFRHKPVSLVTYSMGTYACILNCKQTADMHSKTLQTLATNCHDRFQLVAKITLCKKKRLPLFGFCKLWSLSNIRLYY